MHHNLDNVSTLAPDHEPTYSQADGLTVHLMDSKLQQGPIAQATTIYGNCDLGRQNIAHPTRKLSLLEPTQGNLLAHCAKHNLSISPSYRIQV